MATPRYAKHATATLLVDVALAGARLTRLRAKIFGGACVMEAFRSAGRDLGAQNVEVARQLLAAARVGIVAEDVGGNHGRKLVFRTDNGEAIVKRVSS
jgi:chemotaxis protein CheD